MRFRLSLTSVIVLAVCAVDGVGSSATGASMLPDTAAGEPERVPETAAATDDEPRDLTFRVDGLARLPSGEQRVRARGAIHDVDVELEIALAPRWRDVPVTGTDLHLAWGIIAFRRSGRLGDRFVRALDAVYETDLSAAAMRHRTPFTAVCMQGDPASLDAAPAEFKLLYDGGSARDYAELRLDIDVPHRRVELRETDPAYRAAIVRALAQPW